MVRNTHQPRDMLADIVGFIDEYGRSSCATTEIEHYRLRFVGLMGAATLAKNLAPAIESTLSELQLRQPEHGLGGNVHREGRDLMAKAIANARSKHERINTELTRIISKYSNVLHTTIYADICEKLSFELQQMIYKNLTNMDQRICVDVWKNGNSTVEAARVMYMGPNGKVTHQRPWFCNPATVGDEFTKLMLTTFYATSHFKIDDPGHLQSFFRKAIWGTVAPKRALRRIEIDVPLINYKRPAILDRTRHGLTFLRELCHSKATIILHFSLSDLLVPKLTLKSAQEDAHLEFGKTGREMSDEWWTTIQESIRNANRRTGEDASWVLRNTIQYLLSDLCKVSENGHTVTVKTGTPKWTYTLRSGGPKLELDKLMEDWEDALALRFK